MTSLFEESELSLKNAIANDPNDVFVHANYASFLEVHILSLLSSEKSNVAQTKTWSEISNVLLLTVIQF